MSILNEKDSSVFLNAETFEIEGDSYGFPQDQELWEVPREVWKHFTNYGQRASGLLQNKNVSVTIERRFNLGDFESLNVAYTLGGELPADVDAMWTIDDLHSELRKKIYENVGDEIARREAIAKESFLTTPRNQQQRIIQLQMQEWGFDVESARELIRMGVDLKTVLKEYQQK